MNSDKLSNLINKENIRNLCSYILSLSPFEFTSSATIVGYIISILLTTTEQNSVGNWFELVGQIILTFNAQGSNMLPPSPKQYEDLVNKVNNLEHIIKNLN